jgi:hypothetical protein
MIELGEQTETRPPLELAAWFAAECPDAWDAATQARHENVALRAGREVLTMERVMIPAASIVVTEARGGKAGRYRVAKVGHADRLTANRRVYPRAEWTAAIERANGSQIGEGKLTGALDHVGPLEGGNLKHNAVIWRKLAIRSDGGVFGEFEVMGTDAGRNLQAMLDAGAAIGFSTYGFAQGREPTEAERTLYGIAADDADAVVVQNWRLVKIDAVDDPSVADAYAER